MRRLILAVLLLPIAAALAVVAYDHFEPAALFYPVTGIDVSHHQGEIDWQAVARDGVSFAFIKATESGTHRDRLFEANWRATKEAGIPRGAYHYFTLCRSGEEQAANFIAAVPKDAELPPVIDAEHMEPCRSGARISDVPGEITRFLDRVDAHYGRRPLIYTTREFHDAFLADGFAGERFWMRSLVIPPLIRRDQWTFWQYHNQGRRNGIAGPVDLNAFAGSRAELSTLAKP